LTDGSKNSYNWFGPLTRAPKIKEHTLDHWFFSCEPPSFENFEVFLKILNEPELEVLRL